MGQAGTPRAGGTAEEPRKGGVETWSRVRLSDGAAHLWTESKRPASELRRRPRGEGSGKAARGEGGEPGRRRPPEEAIPSLPSVSLWPSRQVEWAAR